MDAFGSPKQGTRTVKEHAKRDLAKAAVRTKGASVRSAAAKKAARTRKRSR